jgi:hypothetical protein
VHRGGQLSQRGAELRGSGLIEAEGATELCRNVGGLARTVSPASVSAISTERSSSGRRTRRNEWGCIFNRRKGVRVQPALTIGRFCAIASGARFLMSSANQPMLGSTAFPFFIFGGDWLERTADLLPRIVSRGDTMIGK